MSIHTGHVEVSEWREQWSVYRSASFDLARWGLGVGVSIGIEPKWGSPEWGVYVSLGPFHAYVTWEKEQRLYVDGKDTELAVAAVNTPCRAPQEKPDA